MIRGLIVIVIIALVVVAVVILSSTIENNANNQAKIEQQITERTRLEEATKQRAAELRAEDTARAVNALTVILGGLVAFGMAAGFMIFLIDRLDRSKLREIQQLADMNKLRIMEMQQQLQMQQMQQLPAPRQTNQQVEQNVWYLDDPNSRNPRYIAVYQPDDK